MTEAQSTGATIHRKLALATAGDRDHLGTAGPERIIKRAIESAREILGMDMSYVADTRRGRQEYVAVEGDGASFGAQAGDGVPLEGTYCEALLDGRLENIVGDSSTNSRVCRLPITAEGQIGAYIGVPLILSDGRVYGTFCCLSHAAMPGLEERDVRMMEVFGRLIADQLEAEQKDAERLEARLHQSERLESVGQLAGGIAHDFNNLLAVILNYASFVTEELGEEHPARSDVEEIRRAADRAAALTQQLLIFSRRERVRPEVLDLNEVVSDTEKLLRRTLGEHVELVTDLASDLEPIEADRGQLEQVLVNLAVNARDAMPDGGSLTVETSHVELAEELVTAGPAVPPGRYARITVTDTGTGMSREVAERVFEPFYTTKPKGSGTGLGLATVYGIVAQAGGHIDLYSEPGLGTVFKLYLPATESSVASPAESDFEPRRGHGETILLVEDEPAVRELTRRILSRHGYAVLEAQGPLEALETFEGHEGEVDLLLTDVVMPQMSGSELAQRISASQPEVNVLYMSGYTDDFVARQGVADDGVRLLEKPFSSDQLLVAVEGVLESRVSEASPL